MEKKTLRTFLAGLIAGVFAIIGIRTYSKRYRAIRSEFNRLEDELESTAIDLDLAEELNIVATDKVEQIRRCLDGERRVIESARTELDDSEEQLDECERRIAECESIVADCERILHGN